LIKANRFHIGRVVAELQEAKVLDALWAKAKDQSQGIDSLVLAKYIKLRAESLAEEDSLASRRS
tara:strand:- start:660 stop:851 length:192 start_codon:yes stop_codon:yes gene_type:complete